MKGQLQNFLKGIIKENPTFVMMLGMCPTLAVTKTVESALGMGMWIYPGNNLPVFTINELKNLEVSLLCSL